MKATARKRGLLPLLLLLLGTLNPALAQGSEPDGQIVFATRITELESLNPLTVALSRAQAVAYHVNEGLTKFSPTGEIVPGLAESWEISEDNLTYTFKLRENVTWHDGQPFTADDVLFTFEIAMAETTESRAKGTLETYVEGVIAENNAVVVTLKEPFSSFLTTLAEQLLIVPTHAYGDGAASAEFASKPVGTGPYRVAEHGIDAVTLEYNPEYWGELPRTATIILKDAPESAPQLAGLLSGELGVIPYVPNVMGDLEARGYRVYTAPSGSVHGINLDLQNPIFQDARVRKALWLALDRERIKDLHYTEGILADAVVSPAYGPYHNGALEPVSRDVAAANALLDEAGWVMNEASGVREKDGVPLAFKHYAWAAQQWQDIAAIAQASWKEIGAQVEITVVENALIADTISSRYDAAPIGWGLTLDPVVGLDLLFRTTDRTFSEGSTRNIFHYSNPEVDAGLDEALATADSERRSQIVNEIQQIVYNDVPFIPIAYPTYQLASQTNIVLNETGEGTISGVAGIGWFMDRWDVE